MMATTDKETEPRTETSGEATGGETGSGGLRQHASEAYEAARQRTAAAYGTARERASSAYQSTRQQATQTVDTYPLAAVIGGFAVGALIAGLLPRTGRENEVLGGVGGKINDTAREAVTAARDAGREKLDEIGFNREGLSERISEFASSASAAIRNARSGGKGNGGSE
jgi:hypothetical protein